MILSTELGIHSTFNPSNVPLLTIEHMAYVRIIKDPTHFQKDSVYYVENKYTEEILTDLSSPRAWSKSCVSYHLTRSRVYLAWLKHSKGEEKRKAVSPPFTFQFYLVSFLCVLMRFVLWFK